MRRSFAVALLVAGVCALPLAAQEPESQPSPREQPAAEGPRMEERPILYRVLTIRAAPGEFGDWLDQCDDFRAAYVERGDPAPFILRHTQGDHWDLMLIEPWGTFLGYLGADRMAERRAAPEAMAMLEHWLDDAPAFREDLFVVGPPLAEAERLFAENGFYHVEMFHALPYKRQELLEQREMENRYLTSTGRPANTIWRGISGSDVDLFTIGFYPDHAAFAAEPEATDEELEAAARAAGFEGRDQIAPYLRSLIAEHHDTLAVAVE